MSSKQKILSSDQVSKILTRIGYEIYERCLNDKNVVLVGIATKGYVLAQNLQKSLKKDLKWEVPLFKLVPNNTFQYKLEEKSFKTGFLNKATVILVDDVLNSGKTLMYATKTILEYPVHKIHTVVLLDREHRSFPVQATIYGQRLATTLENHIEVEFGKNGISAYLC